ncbi:MAG: hypothetical protein II851_02875 [Bacteroidales bacterium]|nr:hypothetical protein [Bacteroidales bacterium]
MRKTLFFLFAFAMAVCSCVRTQPEEPSGASATVRFTAGVPETRTAFTAPEGDSYPVLWTANDSRVKITLNMLSIKDADVSPAPNGKSAVFTASFEEVNESKYWFALLSPASVCDRASGAAWVIKVPSEQSPTALSVDEKAQILVAKSEEFGEMPKKVDFSLKHWTAYGLLSFENLELSSAKVTGVELTSGKPLTGFWQYDIDSGESTVIDGDNTIRINTASTSGIWFACAPVDLSDTKLTVKVLTDAGDCVKEIDIPAGHDLSSGKVARITVDMKGIVPRKPELKIQRVWGKFSTAAASWNEYYGGTPNTDRNVAMDDEYIYVAETDKSKNLWAISLADPSVVKKLPVGTVAEEGTFYVACPRVIKNSDASVNGGKDVLAVCNMTWGDPKMYFYASGIDTDPSVVEMPTWAERRLGDTFTVWGTLQDGMLFFKDFDNATAVMTFRLEGKVSGSNALQARFVMADGSGAGSYFPYPENIKKGIYVSRDDRKAWWVTTLTDPMTATGGNDCALTQMESGYYKNVPSFQYIEWGGKRYVAYTRQVSSTDGRVLIMEGAATDDWQTLIDAHKVVYQASIQNDVAFYDGDWHQEMDVESPKASGHSGMDLAVREIDGALYIAAIKQNVGLSLFKMTLE